MYLFVLVSGNVWVFVYVCSVYKGFSLFVVVNVQIYLFSNYFRPPAKFLIL